MRLILKSFLIVVLIFAVLYSCQKELGPLPSDGSLSKDALGNCAPVTISGVYKVGQPLDQNNYITVNVTITSPGDYVINTDTVNGYSFSAKGDFSIAGSVQVKLMGNGNPIISDTDHFIIHYNQSFCETSIIINSNATPPADFTLAGSPGNCMDDTLAGSYIKNVLLDTSDNVRIKVNVIKAGSYSVHTNTVNGYSFSDTGVFTNTGDQTIILSATGTPLNDGTDVFTVTADSSSCTFSVTVLKAIEVTNSDHFPLTNNSYWTYDDLIYRDTTISTIIDTANFNGNTYKVAKENIPYEDSLNYYRKNVNDYYEYAQVDKYTSSVKYGKKIYKDLPFLKEGLVTGDSWESDEVKDTASFGQVILLKYYYKCIDANAAITVNGNAFVNVYHIKMQPEISSEFAGYSFTGEAYDYYYAKGVGLVYSEVKSELATEPEYQIRYWKVY